jgi:1-acyl-sn-glycerol-3-phosphate acyltransferase
VDPAFLQAACPRAISFLLAQEYYEIGHFRPLFEYTRCVPVARNGRDVRAVRTAVRRLSEGRVLCIFPEGGLSNAGRNGLRPGKAGIALLALRSRAPVSPAQIAGGPQRSEVLPAWLRPSRVRVRFGPAVDLSAYYDRPISRKLLEEVTALLMDRVRAIGTKPPARARCSAKPLPLREQ